MIVFHKKISGVKIRETWFEYNHSLKNAVGVSSFMYLKKMDRTPLGIRRESYTIENSLEPEVEDIFKGFSSTVRNEIRKVEHIVDCYFHNDIEGFVKFYNDFAALKGIPGTTEQKILEIGEHMIMSYARHGEHILAAHSYIVDYDLGITRLFHSATCRLSNDIDTALIGKANKYLHFRDMSFFKEKGLRIYDFGGYSKDTTSKAHEGINKFKLSFGGEVAACTNYYSYPFWILKKVESVLKKG